jgi:glutamate--cysteine ligase catalytic subunit
MASAQKRDAVTKEKFWWRTSVSVDSPDDFVELSADEIINGKSEIGLSGVAALVEEWVDRQTNISEEQKLKLHNYISLVRRRAHGSSKTNARWMRDYVRSHNDYCKDSIVPECVVYDMLKLIHDVNWGKTKCHDLVD